MVTLRFGVDASLSGSLLALQVPEIIAVLTVGSPNSRQERGTRQ